MSQLPPVYTDDTTRSAVMNYGQNNVEDHWFPLSEYQYIRLLQHDPATGDRITHIHKGIHGTTYTAYTIISLGGRRTYENLVSLYGEIDVPCKFRGYVVRLRKAF
jgi:hypothetical protein